jgi:protein SCO1/2
MSRDMWLCCARMQRLVVTIAAALALSGLLVAKGLMNGPSRAQAEAIAERGPGGSLAPLWDAPDFRYVDQYGNTVTRETLAGDVWVANFVFTQCRTICPLLTTRMVELQRRLAGVKVRFVSFSVDPSYDTPDVLRAYARHWAPDETRWTLLATDEETLPRLAAGFKVTAEKTNDPKEPILHTSVFLLVDGAGRVRGAFDSAHGDQLAALEAGVRKLAKAEGKAAALPTAPEALYHALSCAKCHERAELAPPLVDLRGRRRELESGLVVVADEAWVRESIVQPDAKRVRGYPLRMPSYADVLDEERLQVLVTWVLERRSAGSADAEDEAPVAEDPVCHMQVRVGPGAVTADAGGRTAFFCSESCRARWLADPSAHERRPAPPASP